ncbi:MAG: uncharacterized protein QOD86_641 [Miltoncostaeaceae bacterium]|jgi:uncharacterized protein YcbX|nr:uncharacterized protein [Miltoncostaeaceae bacterium]
MVGPVGTVAELWRYPVKSMRGERVPSAPAGEQGLAGDRHWAAIDAETGKVVSAKRPSLWAAMLQCAAAYVDQPDEAGSPAPVRITLPDGREVRTDDPDRDRRLSDALGRPVRLESCRPEGAVYELATVDLHGLEAPEPDRLTDAPVGMFAPPGTFFDAGTLHLITTASLDAFAGTHPEGVWDVRRFRPNLVVRLDRALEDDFPENGWVGRPIAIGSDAQAAVLAPMPRCVMTTLAQGALPRDPTIMRTIAARNRQTIPGAGVYACAGVLANLTAPGVIAVGDPVSVGASA